MNIIIKLLSVVLTLAYAGVGSAEITGAVNCKAGELAIITCDAEAVWSVYPYSYVSAFAVSQDKKTVYFASPKEGKVTFFAASVTSDGLPKLDQHSLYNGTNPSDDHTEPQPDPAPDNLDGFVKQAAKGHDNKDLIALAESFEYVVDAIDRGVITTTVGARETFRLVWNNKAIGTTPNTMGEMAQLVKDISDKIDNSTLTTLRTDYETVALALRDVAGGQDSIRIPAKVETKAETKTESQTKSVTPAGQQYYNATGNCANGQCGRMGFGWYY